MDYDEHCFVTAPRSPKLLGASARLGFGKQCQDLLQTLKEEAWMRMSGKPCKTQVTKCDLSSPMPPLVDELPQVQRKELTGGRIIIFDWDDTLMCTSFLNWRQGAPLTPYLESQLQAISDNVRLLLTQALEVGHTFIVTNARAGWVEHSVQKFMPELIPLLKKVTIISARSAFENQFPGDSTHWKEQAFMRLGRQFASKEQIKDIVVIGDSSLEMDAATAMKTCFERAPHLKRVLFRKTPTPADLLQEVRLTVENFRWICTTNRSMTIGLERKNNHRSNVPELPPTS